jgi:serine/threonine protein kinase/Tfp pilus assembly protein PilF
MAGAGTLIGQTIAQYRISAELGRGGMGIVYRAHDERLLRSVAIKILSDVSSGSAETRSRMLAEARAASNLHHPGITTIYEVGEDGDSIFLVMELVEGRTLRSLLSDGPLEPKRIVELGAQLAEALEAAHSRGVFHGDIKPENIVVQPDGRAKLLDFGVARHGFDESVTTTINAPIAESSVTPGIQGTIAYLAPEQLRGEPADGRADLYSLGVVFYELASGRRPFTAPTVAALISQIVSGSAPRLKDVAPRAPGALCSIVEKVLEKDPAHRFQSARDLQRELTNLGRELELGAFLPPALAGQRSVAVLPFKLLTPNPSDEYLSIALVDAVINHLSSSGELLVRPAQSVSRYAQRETDPLAAARDLNVHVVVDGSIQKLGAKLRVHVRAWNAADGSALLSAKHDSDAADLFHLQDSIAERVGTSLGLKAHPDGGATGPPTKNPIAYELYLRAADRLVRLNSWDNRAAVDMLENAVKLDPKFADAWARLAEALLLIGTTTSSSPHWVRDAEKALKKAISLDPDNAEAHCAEGRILWSPAKKFQNGPALRALSRALRLNPGCQPARLWQALIFNHIGMLKEAKQGLLMALAARPDDAFTNVFLGHTAMSAWKFEEAEECLDRALRYDPVNIWANVFQPTVLIYAGKLEQAETRIRAAQNTLPGDSWLISCEALLWALRGERAKAARLVRQALHTKAKPLLHTHHMWHTAAAALALLGKPTPAIELLEKAGGFGLPNYDLFRDDKFLQPLKGKQRYERLLAKLKREDDVYRREFAASS